MNDPIDPQSEELQNPELLAFEQQLRSLAPRVANFQLADQTQVEIAGAVHETASTRNLARRVAWAATLLITWSLGAAVGILVTLAYLQPSSVDGSPQDSIAQNAANTEGRAVPQDLEPSDLHHATAAVPNASVVDAPAGRPPTGPTEKTQVEAPNPFALVLFPWQMSAPRGGDAAAPTSLGPLGHSIDFGYSESQPAKLISNTSPSTGQQDLHGMEPTSPVVPIKIDVPPPANQRDMLRTLLDIDGPVY